MTVTYLIVIQTLNRRLRSCHAAQWNLLGQPWFLNNSPLIAWRIVGYYIFSDRYKRLSDPAVNRYALVAKLLFAGCAIGFTIALLCFFARSS
jgi:hypothetical protein